MTTVLAIAAGGALGSVLRYWMSDGVQALFGREFPYGTLAVNVIGCLLIGFLFVVLVDRSSGSTALRAALVIGLLGGFTTFSAFSVETVSLLEQGAVAKAALNTALSLILCVGATWLGMLAARQMGN